MASGYEADKAGDMTTCKWMFADAGRGFAPWRTLASLNPLRWSEALSLDDAKTQIIQLLNLGRPIDILCPASARKTERMFFQHPGDAISYLDSVSQDNTRGAPSEETRACLKRAGTFMSRFNKAGGRNITSMVFKGGGTKGVVYGGAIKRFEEDDLMSHVKKFAGTSAGSQTAALLASGYTADELAEITRTAKWDHLVDHPGGMVHHVANMATAYGFSPGTYLHDEIESKISAKCNGMSNVTFAQHYAIHEKELVLGVCNLSTRRFEYLSRGTTPDMPVSLAVRASSSIPVVFEPVRYNGNMYVDGGCLGNLPVRAFDVDREKEIMVAFNLYSGHDDHHKEPTDFKDFISLTIGMMMDAGQAQFGLSEESCAAMFQQQGVDLVQIDTMGHSTLETHMKEHSHENLIAAGHRAVDKYLSSSD